MRVVIQRVVEASVTVDKKIVGAIGQGLLIFVGIEYEDSEEDSNWLVKKIVNLRIFNDENSVMNLSLKDVAGEALIVSQFTLHASTKKGNRPSYIKAAKPEVSIPLYKQFIKELEFELGAKVATGIFGAQMKVALENDGPVTIVIDSKNKV